MKKTIKLALVITIAILATACSNVKTMSIPGEYRNDKLSLTVSSEGYVGISALPSVTLEEGSFESIMSTTFSYGNLVPWDLTADKAKQEFEVKYSSMNSENKEVVVTLKYVFTKDGDNIKCEISSSGLSSWTVQSGSTALKDGSTTLTKSLK